LPFPKINRSVDNTNKLCLFNKNKVFNGKLLKISENQTFGKPEQEKTKTKRKKSKKRKIPRGAPRRKFRNPLKIRPQKNFSYMPFCQLPARWATIPP